ncbi:MAG TPA: choice-of-anchor tandem repeat GloVer-containing protein [Verrucomicrobiae bacterium]|nr:choice-of-anchor tandem repeat GloVer-containing protein [Verrucomicrobiae bacterium]
MRKSACISLMLMFCCTISAFAQNYKVLYSFQGNSGGVDGAGPVGNLSVDNEGNLYGVTQNGGLGSGTVFELSPNGDGTWTEKIIYDFCSNFVNQICIDGAEPLAGLVSDAEGNLYGTTYVGGSSNCRVNGSGCGTVYELSPPSAQGGTWTLTTLYSFCLKASGTSCLDGNFPVASLSLDASGDLYGTTSQGGAGNAGAIFKLSSGQNGWTESLLYSFCEDGNPPVCPDGYYPQAGVTFDASGNLYGTTSQGGDIRGKAEGTVYKLSPDKNGWTEVVLYAFVPPFSKGEHPLGNLSFDAAGNLYGTTSFGCLANGGSVLRLSPKGTAKIVVFNGYDGASPLAGVLVNPKGSTIYGTTNLKGAYGGGNIFKIGPTGIETVLYDFCQQDSCADGVAPGGGLVSNGNNVLFGATERGGTAGYGVVYQLTP